MSSFVQDRVLSFIRDHGLAGRGDRVLLCVSAGKDSMALLDIMLALREELGIGIMLFHMNHGVRGAESDADERMVRERAAASGLELHVAAMPERHVKGESFEDFARECRYREAARFAGERSCSRIATAHTLDDQAETMLMRIFYGTGIHGLAGMAPRRETIIRPLLCLTSQEVYAYLESRGISWREDRTNSDPAFFRNFIRHEILGRVRERLPSASRSLAELGERARENEEMVLGLVTGRYGELSARADDAVIVAFRKFAHDEALLKWVLSRVIRTELNRFVEGGMIAEICRNLGSGRAHVKLYESATLVVTRTIVGGEQVIRLEAPGPKKEGSEWEYGVPLADSARIVEIPEIKARILVESAGLEEFHALRGDDRLIFIAIPAEIGYISFRNRRPGDHVTLEQGRKKLKDMYIENKLDTARKNDIPLVVADGRIAAVMLGLATGLKHRVSSDFFVHEDSKRILALSAMN